MSYSTCSDRLAISVRKAVQAQKDYCVTLESKTKMVSDYKYYSLIEIRFLSIITIRFLEGLLLTVGMICGGAWLLILGL